MQYFVTGATGFIGKRLVEKLLERKGAVVHFLIRQDTFGDFLKETYLEAYCYYVLFLLMAFGQILCVHQCM